MKSIVGFVQGLRSNLRSKDQKIRNLGFAIWGFGASVNGGHRWRCGGGRMMGGDEWWWVVRLVLELGADVARVLGKFYLIHACA